MLTERPRLEELLAAHGFADAHERELVHDGWSGSRITRLEQGGRRAILKRTSWSLDWIVRATDDRELRESWVAGGPRDLPEGVVAPYLGVAQDGEVASLLMPDLSGELISWVEGAPAISLEVLDLVLSGLSTLHRSPWWSGRPDPPWCPLDRRLTLLARRSAERYRAEGLPAGDRFIAGWDAFDRQAAPRARELVDRLSANAAPLVEALARRPGVGLHGDLKLANVALLPDDAIGLIDWQMTMSAPVEVELGWLLVSNVALLPEPPDAVLQRYGSPSLDHDLVWIVGLLLRGWRKGLDAEAGISTGWGASGPDDLAWWCERAVAAAERHLP